ncbi:sugar ABC transporter permease [Mycetocola tolaasinivorans]|uniref:Sugar ABC transporter permease n=1 Tax=Mycetocola tolaasinivorans TaxID=76635 RepID=A0A3L7A4B9_9MICO|nr:sugar ABC transporter permease [Mycetocola tolaasinivorans]RLP74798.1 sugar ABC transporter permease [Mycetocola tolaasinivorans]
MTTSTPVRERRRIKVPPPLVFVLVLVPFLIEAVGVFWPAIQGISLSFLRWNGIGPATSVGVQNYTDLFSDPIFLTALKNTAIWIVLFGGISFVAGLGVALLFQSERRGVAIYRTAMFLPIVFSLVVTALIWGAFFQPNGVLNNVLDAVGLHDWTRVWLGDPDTALYAVIIAALWREIGYVMVLFIAGLKALDPSVQEAARVDGASAWQRFRFVTLPQLRSVIMVVISVLLIDSLRSFDIVWAMTGGGPFHSTELLSTYMFSTAFSAHALGYASAIAVVIFVLAIAVIISYLVRALSEEKES